MFPMLFDPLYMVFWLPGLAIALGAQIWVKSSFSRYSKVDNRSNLSGAQAARRILDSEGLSGVKIEVAHGFLGDHYDPSAKVLRLSEEVHSGRSLASVGVAAHEAGHAVQDAAGYVPMKARAGLVPIVSLGSYLAFPLLMLGMFIKAAGLMKMGVFLFGGVVLFQVVTLPVEFNASSRAMASLEKAGILTGPEELSGARSVLNAAAMTYVAAAVSSALQLVYFMLRAGMLGGRDE